MAPTILDPNESSAAAAESLARADDAAVGAALAALAERYGLSAIYAFGSRADEALAVARGTARALESGGSDLDVGVLPAVGQRLTARAKVDLMDDLERLFGVHRVDLVVLPEAPPFLAADIVSGELLCAPESRREAEYQLYALRRAGDLLFHERERIRAWLAGEIEP